MADRTMILNLPEQVYDQLQAQAQRHQRRIEDEAALALAATVRRDVLPADLEAAITALATLDDDALWQVSRSQPSVEDGVLLAALIDKRRRDGLIPAEQNLLAELIDRHDRVMVLRAEAIALLNERGRDVSPRVARA